MNVDILREHLMGERQPLETLDWLQSEYLPLMQKQLQSSDVRRRLGIYGGERIPENERNLTDVRNRVSLIMEYEFARISNTFLQTHGIDDLFWSYVVANRFPDLEVRHSTGKRGLRVEVKCLQTIAEEKSANFDTLKKDIHPNTDYLVVFLWEWAYDAEVVSWDRAPLVINAYVFNCSAMAVLRDWYWLNKPPARLGDGLQGFDLHYAVNCSEGVFNEEEGNYGKLLRIWQEDFQYSPPSTAIIDKTKADYLAFKVDANIAGVSSLAHTFLPGLSRGTDPVVPYHVSEKIVGWTCGNVSLILRSALTTAEFRHLMLNSPTEWIYSLNDKYKWILYRNHEGASAESRRGNKPKHLLRHPLPVDPPPRLQDQDGN